MLILIDCLIKIDEQPRASICYHTAQLDDEKLYTDDTDNLHEPRTQVTLVTSFFTAGLPVPRSLVSSRIKSATFLLNCFCSTFATFFYFWMNIHHEIQNAKVVFGGLCFHPPKESCQHLSLWTRSTHFVSRFKAWRTLEKFSLKRISCTF